MDLELHQLDLRYEGLRTRHPVRERRLLASLAEAGQQVPIVVVVSEQAGRWVVIDGYKRVRALRRLGHDVVRVIVWELGEPDALMLERLLRAGEADCPLEQGWFLREVMARFGVCAEELARRFDRSSSWVSARLGLVRDLPEEIQVLVRQGAIGAHGAMKYLVPFARANREDCIRFARAIAPLALPSRRLGELYAVYQGGEQHTRALVLSNPALVLRAREEARRAGTKEQTPGERLLADFEILGSIARRVHQRVRQHAGSLSPRERDDLGRCAGAAWADLASLWRRLEKEVLDAQAAHTPNDPGPQTQGPGDTCNRPVPQDLA